MNIRAENRAQSMLAPWRPSMSRVAVLGLPWWAISLLFLAGYAFLDWASYVSPYRSFNITAWNPGAGLSFALVLLYGQRFLPLVALAPLIGSIAVLGTRVDWPVEIALSLTTGAAYAVGLSFLISPRTRFDASLSTMRDLLLLIATALVSSAIVAVGCISVLYVADQVPASDLVVVLRRFWVGDAIGIMVVAPLLLVFVTGGQFPGFGAETAAMSAAMIAAVVVVFAPSAISHLHLFYVLFLPIIWVGLRTGLEGVTAGLALTQVGLIIGLQFFQPTGSDVTAYQALMLVLVMTGLAVGVLVTERRRTELQLRLQQEAQSRLARLGSMGELASALAHEINQPLMAAGTYSRLVATAVADGKSPHQAREAATKAAAQIERASEVVRRLRTLIKLGRSDLAPVALAQVLAETLELLRPEIDRAGIRIEQTGWGSLPPVMGDALQIQQVLINLVRNAIEAIADTGQEHGTVTIAVARGEPTFLSVEVRDTGPGFPPEFAAEAPAPLKSTKPYGLGVGLSLSRSIVEAHGGRLTFASLRSGAVVRFTLPLAEGAV